MTSFRAKLWTGVGVAVLIGSGGALDACSKPAKAPEPASSAAVSSGPATVAAAAGEGGEAGANNVFAGIPADSLTALHLMHLKGFVLVAEAQPDGPAVAAVLVGQGMLEAYDPYKDIFKASGLDEAVLRKAAQTGSAADLKAAQAAIEAAQARAGGEKTPLAKAMVEIASNLYQEVGEGGIVDPTQYQHSYGAALAAKEAFAAAAKADPKVRAAKGDFDAFMKLWPGPVAPDKPAPAGQVLAQASRIELDLS